jgi:hypothetical protein
MNERMDPENTFFNQDNMLYNQENTFYREGGRIDR